MQTHDPLTSRRSGLRLPRRPAGENVNAVVLGNPRCSVCRLTALFAQDPWLADGRVGKTTLGGLWPHLKGQGGASSSPLSPSDVWG